MHQGDNKTEKKELLDHGIEDAVLGGVSGAVRDPDDHNNKLADDEISQEGDQEGSATSRVPVL